MGLFTRDIHSMNDLFVHQLKDILYAERRIASTMPAMIDKASSMELKDCLRDHLEQTRTHIARLEQVFQMHGVALSTVKCPAIDGILDEADEISDEVDDKSVLDAAIASSAQAVEHYEITRYGTLIAWAKELGHPDCAALLHETLEEEKSADKKLSTISEERLTHMAA
ncbi:YciE/YciF ferroxidase family protein [Gluconacetobacter tumulisoli]|uniref:Ferritin-like domain-containing protein n=1 Tax=Gluconacetobacter tumulisoli TaxID=1286189 RepID=A0A7W4K531_9PROT|nr:ferritin-like domain-containing protein [Gluconacetobacter tumulisoli]MBB2200548.1 ferritin-like domain-containing protein [Gluconacetobacter tumulisoli]